MNFFCVYIREAHPEDGWQIPMNATDDVVFMQPKTYEERAAVAEACVLRLNLEMPMLLDTIDDEVDRKYAALPERLYVIDRDGVVTYQAAPGPFGFDPEAWAKALAEVVRLS